MPLFIVKFLLFLSLAASAGYQSVAHQIGATQPPLSPTDTPVANPMPPKP